MRNFLNTFRGRLLVILAFLLITTLAVQFVLNWQMENQNKNLRAVLQQALVDGLTLGAHSMTSGDRLQEFVKKQGQSFFDEISTQRIKDIMIIDPDWEIYDSLSDDYLPVAEENGETRYFSLSDVKNLPPLMQSKR